MLANIFQALVIAPLVHPLKLTSTYELLYMSVVLLAPSLALEAVAGIPLWLSVVVVGVIGTIYTAIGTLKAGGLSTIMEVAEIGNRVNFRETSPDPRVRHTIWGLVLAGFFNWLPNCCNQSAVQRMCSMRSVRDSKISTLLNAPLVLLWGVLMILTGILMFSYFTIQRCDPWSAGYIENPNQIVPYFVMHVFHDVPGLPGLLIAALFSGALSSLSSGINSMSANTIQDILVNVLKYSTEFRKTLVAKLVVILYGFLAVCLAYLGRSFTGTVTQIALSAIGATGGPMVGMMFLGAIFPQANWIGALGGGVIGIAINIWIALSTIMYGKKAPQSARITTDGCLVTSSTMTYNHSVATVPNITTEYMPYSSVFANTSQTSRQKKRKRKNKDYGLPVQNTRIKSLDLTWYNQQPDDQL
ncbi:hypothetical protein ACF0H5_003742 [Mactra antiquata]